MRMKRVPTCLACLFLSLALIRCASPIDKMYRQEAVSTGFSAIHQDPEAYEGDTVVWGGSIIRTIPSKQGSSVYVLETKLGCRDKPKATETSSGRFVAKTDRRLDPLIYARGRKITVAGKVVGQEIKTSRKTGLAYTYPVVQVEQVHLWPVPEKFFVPPPFWWGGSWGWGPYGEDPFFEEDLDNGAYGEEGAEGE